MMPGCAKCGCNRDGWVLCTCCKPPRTYQEGYDAATADVVAYLKKAIKAPHIYATHRDGDIIKARLVSLLALFEHGEHVGAAKEQG